MTLTPQEWHQRFTRQAQWTQHLRAYLYQRTGMKNAHRVLEVGCGTGAILADLPDRIPLRTGLDIDAQLLFLAIRNTPEARLAQGDGQMLPYPDDCFDISLCHFLLLWLDDPARVLNEMIRVTCPGGAVLALAEPDYGGRIDYPDELGALGQWQMQSLRQQGADPLMGRKLAGLFQKIGLEAVETGALGGQWSGTPDWGQWESEWATLESDLTKISEISGISDISRLKERDRLAYQRGERVLFVPTFYAWGRVPI